MGNQLELTLVVENNSDDPNLSAEHALAIWIDYNDHSYLFDTGQGEVLTANLDQLDLVVDDLDGVFVSHGHFDHAGGLAAIIKQQQAVPVYAHRDIWLDKYSVKREGLVWRGFELELEEMSNFKAVTELTEIEANLWLTGEVPRQNEMELLDENYQLEVNEQLEIDKFRDDQTLILDTSKGLVILLGCSHVGVINILKYIEQKFTANIQAIIGGMHLVNAEQDRIEWTINQLAKIDWELLIPLHCTGQRAVEQMKDVFGDRVKVKSVGESIKI
jgi:7,8-dihydropterin-6-yl-methyl-4-(beta-D-ribofuranosyl)aminobenzene 5'-phosphate synthase